MRRLYLTLLVIGLLGCSKREQPGPSVHVVNPDAGSDVDSRSGAEPVVKPKLPESLLEFDFVKLWDQTGPRRLSPDELRDQHFCQTLYSDNPDQCLAAELVGSGMAGPVSTAVRLKVQPDVLKRVRAAADTPLVIPSGGNRASAKLKSKRTVVISLNEPFPETRARFDKFNAGVIAEVKASGASEVVDGGLDGVQIGRKIAYTFASGTGTISLALRPPNAARDALDAVIAPGDEITRSLLADLDMNETVLVAVVEEKPQP
jgi:hypothetical protein